MSDGIFQRHVARLKSSLSAHSQDTICDFITEHTYLRGEKFSFVGREYQKKILEDKSQDIVILKSAQIGISEMSARLALARSVLVNGFSTIYTLPSALDGQRFMKTRVDPVIDSSPYLSELVSKEVDNSAVKRFGDSYLYLRGAQVDRQAISIPADLLVVDEVDNSNQDVITLYESRLIASPYALTIKLSTPTVPGYGIDRMYKQSRRHVNMCKCNHCGERFYPTYYEHVRVPGFDGELDDITRNHFANPNFRWAEAFVACPKCGKEPDLGPEHREWVIENPDEAFLAAGYRISPFDCPGVIKPSALVKASVSYARKQDFANQRLGIPLEDKEASLTKDELEKVLIRERPGSIFSYVLGLDMGATCWATVMAVLPDNTLIIVHTEGIPLFRVIERRRELAAQFRIRMTVVDHGPYTETVWRMQQESVNVFAGVYVRSKTTDLYKVKEVEEDKDKGIEALQQVNIARDKVFDLIMLMLRSGQIIKVMDANDETWKDHLTDMKRVREFVGDEMVFTWVKVSGNDHLHHSLLYAFVASRMLGVSTGSSARLPLISTFPVKPQNQHP